MAGPPVPPPAQPGPPEARPDEVREPIPEEARERRQNRWLLILTVIALLAAGGAGYAISEVESAKDENREDDRAVNTLRADLEVLREQVTDRLDEVEGQAQDAADATTQRRLENEIEGLDKRVQRLDQQSGGGDTDALQNRVDDLEQRVEDVEQDSN